MNFQTFSIRTREAFEGSELRFFRILFVLGASWNLIGAVFGYFNTTFTYHELFGRHLTDPLQFAIYKGSWGTTLLYFFGYLIVAANPVRHFGIVIIGTVGKVFFASKLLSLYWAGLAQYPVLVIVIGDFLFTVLFVYYLYRMFVFRTASVSIPSEPT